MGLMAGVWTLGWEFVLALVTLLLASLTGWLAWTTRRLARATAEEVQGQMRPVVVPATDAVTALEPSTFPGGQYFNVAMRLRNIGAGPALNIRLAAGPGSSGRVPRPLAAGGEVDAAISVPVLPKETAHQFIFRTQRITIDYQDLADHPFTTVLGWVFVGYGEESRLSGTVRVSSGSAPEEIPMSGPGLIENPLIGADRRRHPTPLHVRYALTQHLFQDPDAPPLPLSARLRSTWRAVYPPRRRTRLQRATWGVRAYRSTLDKPIPPKVPGFLHSSYKRARGLKWGYLVYRRLPY